jgi:oligopeptide/dipeptide ABC transporter ATP-binding protein
MSSEILALDRVTKTFRTSAGSPFAPKLTTVAVDDISLTLTEGRTVSLVGESGCGKTTTARLLLGLESPDSGTVQFRGASLEDMSRSERKRYRAQVQAVFQDPRSAMDPRQRIRDIVAEPAVMTGRPSRASISEMVNAVLEEVGLEPQHAARFPHELSGGQRQRVMVARALVSEPSLVVLDEPVSALDVSVRAQILNLLLELQGRRGIGFLLISHDLATVRSFSDHVIVIYLGRVVESGTVEDIFRRPSHPYTIDLLRASIPVALGRDSISLSAGLERPTVGCPYRPRCWLNATLGQPEACETTAPVAQPLEPDDVPVHTVACHFPDDAYQRGGVSVLATMAAAPMVDPTPGPS